MVARAFSALGRSLRGITFSVLWPAPERSRTFSALGSRADGSLLALYRTFSTLAEAFFVGALRGARDWATICDARPELCGSSRPKHGGVRRSRFPMLQIVDPQLLAWQTPLSTHVHTFFVRRGPPEIIEITARDHCPTARRSSPHSPLLSSAHQLASPHSPRPA